MENLETEIKNIKDRNLRVELDKAWEVSWTRRIFISMVTYLVATFWLYVINEQNFWLKAIIPTVGYILSTITIPQLKKLWISRNNTNN